MKWLVKWKECGSNGEAIERQAWCSTRDDAHAVRDALNFQAQICTTDLEIVSAERRCAEWIPEENYREVRVARWARDPGYLEVASREYGGCLLLNEGSARKLIEALQEALG